MAAPNKKKDEDSDDMAVTALWENIHLRDPVEKPGIDLVPSNILLPTFPLIPPPPTLVHALHGNAQEHPNHVFVRWANKNGDVEDQLTYKQLWDQSSSVACLLLQNDVQQGDRVMIAYPFGLSFLAGLIGCMRMGAVPCSVYPPDPTKKGKAAAFSYEQFNKQVQDAGAIFALTTSSFKSSMRKASILLGFRANVKWLASDSCIVKKTTTKQKQLLDDLDSLEISRNDIAFVQYSSGSTGEPKGVVISHGALIHQLAVVSDATIIKEDPRTLGVCWLPQYHDYALILFFLMPMFSKHSPSLAFSPIDFIRNPLLWADIIEKFQATHTAGPNFSYSLLAKRMKAANRTFHNHSNKTSRLVGVDIAAEPIAPSTLVAMKEIGIPEKAIQSSYGLAESCVYVTSCTYSTMKVLDGVVSCGYIPRNERYEKFVKIANKDDGIIVKDGEVGNIYIRGPDLATSYWGKPELDGAFQVELSDGHRYLATGDLGKIVEDLLYVMGRDKELIIINGRNYYPVDLERTIESTFPQVVRPGSTVAFQHTDSDVGLVIEIRKNISMKDVTSFFSCKQIRELIGSAHGLSIGRLDVLLQGTVPKTTSGKLRRIEARKQSVEDRWESSKVALSWRSSTTAATFNGDIEAHGSSTVVVPKLGEEPEESCSAADVPSMMECTTTTLPTCAADKQLRPCSDTAVESTLAFMLGEEDLDMDKPWDMLGLTSLQATEFSSQIARKTSVQLPIDFVEACPTPRHVVTFVNQKSVLLGQFEVILPDLEETFDVTTLPDVEREKELRKLSRLTVTLFQGIAIILLMVVLGLALIPPFLFAKLVASPQRVTFEVGSSGRLVSWSSLPFTVPIFALTFSVLVVVLKWTVVGRYKSGVVELPLSATYLRWWFIDRLMDLWELFVGQFVLDTQFIWLFYRMLGAKVAWSANIDGFLREADLVSVGGGTSIKHQILCRKFVHGKDVNQVAMRLRPIEIGQNCQVRGMVSPGVSVGDGSEIAKHAAVVEGAQIPEGVLAKGAPAFQADTVNPTNPVGVFEILGLQLVKILWLFIELYLFFGLFLVSQIVLNDHLPSAWRYTPLLYWFLILPLTSTFGLIVSILLKWIFLGKRKEETSRSPQSTLTQVSEWVCDYHFRLSRFMLLPLCCQSKIWNVILFLHGLDIDGWSVLNCGYDFKPSEVDFIKIHRSFVSTVSFDVGPGKGKIEIVNSNVGYDVHICGGTKVVRSIVPPRATVEQSLFDSRQGAAHDASIMGELGAKNWWFMRLKIATEGLQLLLNMVIFGSLIPSFEVFNATVYNGSLAHIALFGLFLAAVVQLSIWTILASLVEWMTLKLPPKARNLVFAVYIGHVWQSRTWTFVFLLYGTPFMSYWLRFMGALVDGEIWYFGSMLYELRKLRFAPGTIIDRAHISGHSVVLGEAFVAETHIGGIIHPGCYASAGTVVLGGEHGPWRAFVGKSKWAGSEPQLLEEGELEQFIWPLNQAQRRYVPWLPMMKWVCDVAATLLCRPILTGRENTRRCYERVFDSLCAATGVWSDYTEGYFQTGKESYEDAKLAQFDFILDKTGSGEGTRLLDIGCGNGKLLQRARERGCAVSGLTICRTQAATCQASGLDVRANSFDSAVKEFGEGVFDVVVVNGCSEHIVSELDELEGRTDEVRRTLMETVQRVLKPGGRLFITCIHFRWQSDIQEALKPVISHPVGSYYFHISLLTQFYSGWYPMYGDYRRFAEQCNLMQVFERDATQDYYRTSTMWVDRLQKHLASHPWFGFWFNLKLFFDDPRYFFITFLYFHYDPWTWQFFESDVAESPMIHLWLMFEHSDNNNKMDLSMSDLAGGGGGGMKKPMIMEDGSSQTAGSSNESYSNHQSLADNVEFDVQSYGSRVSV